MFCTDLFCESYLLYLSMCLDVTQIDSNMNRQVLVCQLEKQKMEI